MGHTDYNIGSQQSQKEAWCDINTNRELAQSIL